MPLARLMLLLLFRLSSQLLLSAKALPLTSAKQGVGPTGLGRRLASLPLQSVLHTLEVSTVC